MAIVSLVPLAFVPNGYFIFLPIKFTLVTVLVFGGLALLIAQRKPLALSTALFLYLAFLGVLILAALFGVGGLISWIGYPGRSLGLIAWATFGGAFFLGSSTRDRRTREQISLAASAASILISAYALFQAAGVDPLEWSEAVDVSRARSTLGNAAFLGAYLTLIVPLCVRLALAPFRLGERVIHALAALVGIAALLSTQTRGAWLGVIAGLALLAMLEVKRIRSAPGWSLVAAGLALALVIVLAAFSPLAPRIRSIFDPTTGTARGRLTQWQLTLDLIRDRPIAGWGPETYAFVFPRYIDAEFERKVGREVIPDRAHNFFLDIASIAGVSGLAAVLAALALIIWSVARLKTRDPVTIGIAAACIAYFVQLQFSFSTPDLDTMFWLFAGVLAAPTVRRSFTVPKISALAPAACAVLLFVWGIGDVIADQQLRQALEAEESGRPVEALTSVGEAVSSGRGRTQYLQAAERLYRSVGEASGNPHYFITGLQIVERAIRSAPRDSELAMDRADLFLSWGQTGEEQRIDSAITEYEKILASDPFSSRVHLKVGVAYVIAGRTEEAEKAWLTAADLAPRSTAPLINLGRLYEQSQRLAEARRAYEQALLIAPEDVQASAGLKRLGLQP